MILISLLNSEFHGTYAFTVINPTDMSGTPAYETGKKNRGKWPYLRNVTMIVKEPRQLLNCVEAEMTRQLWFRLLKL